MTTSHDSERGDTGNEIQPVTLQGHGGQIILDVGLKKGVNLNKTEFHRKPDSKRNHEESKQGGLRIES